MARAVGGKAANSVLLDHHHCGVVPIDSLRVGVLTAKDTQRSISIVLSQVGVRAEISPWIKQSLNVFIERLHSIVWFKSSPCILEI